MPGVIGGVPAGAPAVPGGGQQGDRDHCGGRGRVSRARAPARARGPRRGPRASWRDASPRQALRRRPARFTPCGRRTGRGRRAGRRLRHGSARRHAADHARHELGASRGQRRHARLRLRPVGRRPGARRDRPAARGQLRPRGARGRVRRPSTHSSPGRPARRPPSGTRPARRRSWRRPTGFDGVRVVVGSGSGWTSPGPSPPTRPTRRAAGSWAATSRATGRRAWSRPSA